MNDSIKLNTRQLTLLMSNLLITKMIFAFPRFLFKTSGNAAWIQAIYMTVLAYILLIISLNFYKRTGNRSIIQLAESIGKTPLKILVSLVVSVIIIAKPDNNFVIAESSSLTSDSSQLEMRPKISSLFLGVLPYLLLYAL